MNSMMLSSWRTRHGDRSGLFYLTVIFIRCIPSISCSFNACLIHECLSFVYLVRQECLLQKSCACVCGAGDCYGVVWYDMVQQLRMVRQVGIVCESNAECVCSFSQCRGGGTLCGRPIKIAVGRSERVYRVALTRKQLWCVLFRRECGSEMDRVILFA